MSVNPSYRGKQAIVIGASMGGLLTARVLRNHFEKVILIEKDKVADDAAARKGQPHTRHLHGLLPAGLNVMESLFQGLLDELKSAGASVLDFAASMHWYTHGGYRKSFDIGMPAVSVSRPLLEQVIRKQVLAIPGILLLDDVSVKNWIITQDREWVVGVEATIGDQPRPESYYADLVVDTSGRGSRTPQWLKDTGYEAPAVSEVKVNLGYASRLYERDPEDPRGKKWIFQTPVAPDEYCSAGAFPIEGNRWIVTLAGWHGRHAALHEEGFRAFAKALPVTDFYDIITTCKPLSDITPYKYAASQRRHYEKLRRFPKGYLVLGDAFCSFNPVYGQGMTSAALQVQALDSLLKQGISPEKLARRFFKKTARIIDIPWNMAVGEDYRYPETTGPKPAGISLINSYISNVHKATLKDEKVCKSFLQVMSLLRSPVSLFHPEILWRVWRT